MTRLNASSSPACKPVPNSTARTAAPRQSWAAIATVSCPRAAARRSRSRRKTSRQRAPPNRRLRHAARRARIDNSPTDRDANWLMHAGHARRDDPHLSPHGRARRRRARGEAEGADGVSDRARRVVAVCALHAQRPTPSRRRSTCRSRSSRASARCCTHFRPGLLPQRSWRRAGESMKRIRRWSECPTCSASAATARPRAERSGRPRRCAGGSTGRFSSSATERAASGWCARSATPAATSATARSRASSWRARPLDDGRVQRRGPPERQADRARQRVVVVEDCSKLRGTITLSARLSHVHQDHRRGAERRPSERRPRILRAAAPPGCDGACSEGRPSRWPRAASARRAPSSPAEPRREAAAGSERRDGRRWSSPRGRAPVGGGGGGGSGWRRAGWEAR